MELFVRDEDKEKYESFSLMGYYHANRKGEENTDLKECLIQDIWVSDDDENLPRLTVKSLEQHDTEIRKPLEEKIKRLETELSNDRSGKSFWIKNILEAKQEAFDIINKYEKAFEDLQQKLNEMKGETK